MMASVSLEEDTAESLLSRPFSAMRGLGKKVTARKETLTRTQPCWHPDLRIAASRTVRNKYVPFEPPPL